MRFIEKILFVFAFLSFAVLLTGCKKKDDAEKTVISIKGSDTMVNLAQKWAEEYMKNNPSVSIQVTGGGSGTGVAALLNGTTDIATSSRELKDKEIELAKTKNVTYKEYAVALDGIAVIVHPDNPLDSLTMEQVRDIFAGKIKSFDAVGGQKLPISIYGRENSSGTYEFFKEHVLGRDANGNEVDYATSTQVLQGTAALAEAVAKDKKSIAYGGVGYFAQRKDVKVVSIKKDAASPAIAPVKNNVVDYEDIWSGAYSISRNLYMFTVGTPSAGTEKFIAYVLSQQGQDVVKTMEYIPLPQK